MPNGDPPLIIGIDIGPFLAVHLSDRRGGMFDIIGRIRISPGQTIVQVLQIRQIDLNIVLERADRLCSYRNWRCCRRRSGSRRAPERVDDHSYLRDKMGRGDKADCPTSRIENASICAMMSSQLQPGLSDSGVAATDLPVLAVNALHIASGEEDVADAMFTGDDRFFPPMRADRTDRKLHPAVTDTPVFCQARSAWQLRGHCVQSPVDLKRRQEQLPCGFSHKGGRCRS